MAACLESKQALNISVRISVQVYELRDWIEGQVDIEDQDIFKYSTRYIFDLFDGWKILSELQSLLTEMMLSRLPLASSFCLCLWHLDPHYSRDRGIKFDLRQETLTCEKFLGQRQWERK